MKIMIPYDGSKNTEKALSALRRRADFAQAQHDALIVVSDVWLADSAEEFSRAVKERRLKVARAGVSSHVPALSAWEEERVLSREALSRITSMFPLWNVKVETLPGFSLVSSEMLEKAERSKVDVIVIGAGKSFPDNGKAYGGGALRVANEATCNVFLARDHELPGGRKDDEYLPTRIALVLNGTNADERIVKVAARRKWAPNSKAGLVLDGANRPVIGETQATELLKASGLNVSVIEPEDSSPMTTAHAVVNWNPDSIFTCGERNGENGGPGLKRKTEALLRRADCSVELVRRPVVKPKVMRAAA